MSPQDQHWSQTNPFVQGAIHRRDKPYVFFYTKASSIVGGNIDNDRRSEGWFEEKILRDPFVEKEGGNGSTDLIWCQKGTLVALIGDNRFHQEGAKVYWNFGRGCVDDQSRFIAKQTPAYLGTN